MPSFLTHKKIFFVLLFMLAAILSLLNYNVPFVYDDMPQIQYNPSLNDPFNFEAIINDALRPNRIVQNFTFALNWFISPGKSWSYHVFNNLLHFLNAWLVFLLLPLLGVKNKSIQYFATLLFFIHPLQVEPVTYIMGRIELLKTLFTLLILWCYLQNKRNKILIYVLLIISLSVKETCVLIPLLLIGLDLTIGRKSFGQINWKEHLFYISHILWLIPLQLIYRNMYEGSVGFTLFPFWDYILANLYYLTFYLSLFFNPSEQSIFHEMVVSPSVLMILGGVLMYLAMFYLLLRKRHIYPSAVFFIIFFIISFSPNNSILQFINPFAEYRLYQSNIVLSLSLGFLLLHGINYIKARRLLALLLICYFAFFHVLYIRTWKHPVTLWGYATETYPDSLLANLGLANTYINSNMCFHALELIDRVCVDKNKFDWKCDDARTILFTKMNKKSEALDAYLRLHKNSKLSMTPRTYISLLSLAEDTRRLEDYKSLIEEGKIKFPKVFGHLPSTPLFVTKPENLYSCMDEDYAKNRETSK